MSIAGVSGRPWTPESGPLQVAIVGSGPSGFYAAEELLQSPQRVEVSMIERLPVPYGLVRSGVAPDHPKLKQPILVYERTARTTGYHYFGNVKVDRDVSIADLLETHHAVILAYGTSLDHKLDIPGEHLPGSHSATEFVGWYNAHPDYRSLTFELSQEVAVIIGQGNVALDVARILAKPIDVLRHTDIAQHALDSLAESRIKEIHIFGRRGPAQAKFAPQELSEFARIPGCIARVEAQDLELGPACHAEVADKMNRNIARNLEILRSFASTPEKKAARQCHFHFFRNPKAVLGSTCVEGITSARTTLTGEPFQQRANDSQEIETFPCGVVFRSIGYRGTAVTGLSLDLTRGVLRNTDGRLENDIGQPLHGLYATGWIKRGANGVIGSNRADSLATVATLLADLSYLDQRKKSGWRGLAHMLVQRNKSYVTQEQWRRIDAAEVSKGKARGKPREKFTYVDEMLQAGGSATRGSGHRQELQ